MGGGFGLGFVGRVWGCNGWSAGWPYKLMSPAIHWEMGDEVLGSILAPPRWVHTWPSTGLKRWEMRVDPPSCGEEHRCR